MDALCPSRMECASPPPLLGSVRGPKQVSRKEPVPFVFIPPRAARGVRVAARVGWLGAGSLVRLVERRRRGVYWRTSRT